MVFYDKTSYREAKDADDCSEFTYSKKALGIKNLGLKYRIGYFYISTHQKSDQDHWWDMGYFSNGHNITSTLVDKHEVLDTLARLVFVFNHNQEEDRKNGGPSDRNNYLKFP